MKKNKIGMIALLLIHGICSCKNAAKNPEIAKINNIQNLNAQQNQTINYLDISNNVLTALKNKDYKTLETFIHPENGLLFAPYGFIDTATAQKFPKNDFANKIAKPEILNWGRYDGTGEPIALTAKQYFEKFVYDADFLNAESKNENKIIAKGNSVNNIDKVFQNSNFTEFYFSGFKKELQGMDWKSIKLIFQEYQNKTFLTAIVHDQWTS